MEALMRNIYNSQLDLEDALLLESSLDEAKDTDDGRKLIRYLKKRRRIINRVLNLLEKL
jgi:hypothetical protein